MTGGTEKEQTLPQWDHLRVKTSVSALFWHYLSSTWFEFGIFGQLLWRVRSIIHKCQKMWVTSSDMFCGGVMSLLCLMSLPKRINNLMSSDLNPKELAVWFSVSDLEGEELDKHILQLGINIWWCKNKKGRQTFLVCVCMCVCSIAAKQCFGLAPEVDSHWEN